MTGQQTVYNTSTSHGFGVSKSMNSKTNTHNVSRGGMGYQTSEEQCNISTYYGNHAYNKSQFRDYQQFNSNNLHKLPTYPHPVD